MLQGKFPSASDFTPKGTDIQKVLQKSPDDLAESLEIMVCEVVRTDKTKRATLRGAICLLRGETTTVKLEDAVHALMAMKGLWIKEQKEHRALICQRSIEILESANAH